MSSFAGPSYLTVRSPLCVILIWDPCIFNLYNLCQTGSSYLRRKPQCALRFNEQITRTHFLLLQPSIRPVPAQVILLWKGLPKLCIECYLVPLRAFAPKSPGPCIKYAFELFQSKHSIHYSQYKALKWQQISAATFITLYGKGKPWSFVKGFLRYLRTCTDTYQLEISWYLSVFASFEWKTRRGSSPGCPVWKTRSDSEENCRNFLENVLL